ncbi:hypothetical protein GGH19_002102 [Coemansia sp. RSA 1807]|nr:hypothetical protein LPJ58_005286 [Coemansia sp. RSA 1591]KAJ2131961.1 hypothetical protein GGF48_001244 [Coemansia sp. RSA 921]KAJ2166579.1 hypothetical protein GGH15_002669 [Coemansia sp. RSA 562]KAJ2181647.1 hypothetical protein GGF45_001405 [Coemansia sp. RSA 551]KAJ2196145.1 hypothetical protein GGH18_001709 [Coemansia sp. RSA 530]KAJ2275681.1 hypothetical protein J3F81_001707 [Coemansia sp. RSA 371]KAJ2280862.1 hypothetical protein EV176_000777 [Coemansia sp. RSA 451]KAJ2282479.1 hy
MEKILLPVGCVTCYFVRHGERIDHIDDTWAQRAQTPYDPPLTNDGHMQAQRTGALIHTLEQNAASSTQRTEYLVLTSPFLRCVQTSEELCRGFHRQHTQMHSSLNTEWQVAVEPGLCEVMSENYFAEPVPDSLIDQRISDIASKKVCGNMAYDTTYTQVKQELPTYPENFQDMMARFVGTLDYTTSRQIDEILAQADVEAGVRKVVVMVTHGAGVGSLLWATTRQPGAHTVPYCCLTQAQIVARTSQPLSMFGTTRIPAYQWTVNYRAYSEHLPNL